MREWLTSLTVATGTLALVSLNLATAFAQNPSAEGGAAARAPEGGSRGIRGGRARANRPPAGPTPRLPDNPFYGVNAGKPDLGGKGMWQVPYIINMASARFTGTDVDVPFRPEAKRIFDERTANHSKDDPEGFCLPPGVPRMMYTPYPAQIYQMADRILFIFEGGAHVWRIIWMDGRKHPADPNPTFLGDSIGRWEGDTLVVETAGFNDRTALDLMGHPHSDALRVVERYRRRDFGRMDVEMTFDDPKMYTKPFTNVRTWVLMPKSEEVLEYVCTENNKEVEEHHIK